MNDADRLLLAQADAALLLVDPADGRVVRSNPVWASWLGVTAPGPDPDVFWAEAHWQQPEVMRTLVSLAALPLPLPPLPVLACAPRGQVLPLLLSAKAVMHRERRRVLCTLVRQSAAAAAESGHEDQALQAVVQTLTAVLERHDPASVGHQRRVAHLAATLARRLGCPAAEVHSIELAAWLHDLGMVSVPAATLDKRELLSTEEVRQIQQHVQTGLRMLEHIEFPGPVTTLIAQHHERINGSGYPAGLSGPAILRGAQLIGMADTLDAMTRDRPYQRAQTMDQALGTLLAGAGVLFDADLVQTCVQLFVDDGYRFPTA